MNSFYIKTFGCQMNYADSEKIHMILMSAGLRKVIDPVKADIVIMNTCSVRQKGEDRVFGFMNEIARYHKQKQQESVISDQNGTENKKEIQSANCKLQTANSPIFGITGCMVRQSGMAKRYLGTVISTETNEVSEVEKSIQSEVDCSQTQDDKQKYKRKNAEKITLLESSDSLMNYDDELFLRSLLIDFTFRIEEVGYLTKILSLITGEDIGNDAKFHEYLQVKQLQENPASANIIIQTGCDNYCTFCIVPHTRGREVSRPEDEIVKEIEEVVANGSKEVTLLGQNVNSYGKETKAKLWNPEELKWDKGLFLKGDGLTVPDNSPLWGVSRSDGVVAHFRKYESEILSWPDWWKNSLFPYWNLPRNKDLEESAKKLRKAGILSEVRFWQYFKDKKSLGFDIDRQVIIGNYIVDFFIPEVGLIFEIDGSSHEDKQWYDTVRDDYLENLWLKIIHFTWNDVLHNAYGVYEQALKEYRERCAELGAPTPVFDHPSRGELVPGALKTPFRELLERIDAIPDLDRIRFTSSNPHDMTRDILDAHFDLPRMCPYLHFALQSGSDTMLKKMNRKHTYADFKAQVDYLRSRDPLFSISTDIIVGFPGETEEEFQATATAMRECQFDFAFIARYSPRSGTIATTKYEDDITPEEKARRWTILNDILRETVHTRNGLMVGREEEILISWEGKDETWVGRTRNFKEVFIPKDESIKIWDLVKVKITESDGWVLRGEKI
jgi:tRNA A37 methylthiotransferase MiaB/very-short-patch-repair endonuclease